MANGLAETGRPAAESELAALMDEHGRAVLVLAFAYLRDRSLAEDVFQEVFVRADRARRADGGPARTRSWLLAVTANLCRSQLRARSRCPLLLVAEIPESGGASPDGADAALARERDRELAEAVLALPVPLREAVVLYYYEGLSTPEVAEALGVGAITVRTRLHRARSALRRALERPGDV
jgi:RNA polymerase sigma-70 factor (ECF subfamily)